MLREDADQYLDRNLDFRGGVGLVMPLSEEEEADLEDYLWDWPDDPGYNFLGRNCGDPIEKYFQSRGYLDPHYDTMSPRGLYESLEPFSSVAVSYPGPPHNIPVWGDWGVQGMIEWARGEGVACQTREAPSNPQEWNFQTPAGQRR